MTSHRNKNSLGIFKKFLLSFLFLSLLPLTIFGLLTFLSIQSTGDKIISDAFLMVDLKTQKTLEIQASSVARRVENFLHKCENDLFDLVNRPINSETLLSFSKNIQGGIWERYGQDDQILERKYFLPIYKEISFIDLNGNEKIKIKNSKIVDQSELKNIVSIKNTTYKCENYFTELSKLKKGDIYFSRLYGFHVSMKEQLKNANDLMFAVDGKEYDGLFRIGSIVHDRSGNKIGYLLLGLDHRHLMEFTQHILPNSNEQTVFPSYNSGDYAFIFDDEGWIITHPKFWDIKGYDKMGNLVQPYSKDSPKELIDEGKIPFNLFYAGFIHENYPVVANKILNKEISSVITTNVGGIKKIMAFAPIKFSKSVYQKHGVFGGVTIGSEITKFQIPSYKIRDDISAALHFIIRNILLFILGTFIIAVIASWFISRHFTNPIIKLTQFAQIVAEGELDHSITSNRVDEIGILTDSFNKMTSEIKKGRNQILFSYRELQDSEKNIANYAKDLEYQLKILRSIQNIGNILGSTFELNSILKYILQSCVETVNFDRAILYLIDSENENYLECKEMYGFSEDEEKSAINSKYNIENVDCIETRVVKSGEIIFVDDFENYKYSTSTDIKIRKIAKSNSFVFVPLRVKEKIIGILGADKLRSKMEITETDINSLQILANQASRVIENTMLYTEVINQRNFVEDIISNMINGVISTDGNGKITSINKAAKDILNLKSEKVIGLQFWNLFVDSENLMADMRKSLAETNIYKGYNVEINLGDNIKYININASRVYHNNIHTNSIIILEDVTERKIIEEELQNVNRLASLGKFAAGIAHEIRNPLTGLSLFLDDLHDNLDSKNKGYSQMITTALSEIERLDHLIKEILEYALPVKSNYRLTNVNDLINSIIILVDNQIKKSNINLSLNLKNELPLINVDPEKIKQALINIILNSIYIMNNGGSLIITTKTAKLKFIELIIEDTGKGLTKEELKNLFDPFYTNREGGTGLGLAITYSIIMEHSGTVQALNRKTKGAKFIIKLPIK